jgi:hypothetical protein
MTASDQTELEIKDLDERLRGVQDHLRSIVERDQLAELVPIWRRPGWTTPAELFLVRESLAGLAAQVAHLERGIDAAVRGADLVGRQ